MTRRVVVTGVGLVCALGIGTEESWRNLVAGCSGIAPITHFDTAGFDCKIAGEVKNFDPFQWIEKKELKKMARFIQIHDNSDVRTSPATLQRSCVKLASGPILVA